MAGEALHFPEGLREVFKPYLPRARPVTGQDNEGPRSWRPHVTLTYAASLDSMIAAAPGTRTALSGHQSKAMTHYLRTRHDAILVGRGTANADDPTLNSRLEGATLRDQPQPVIVDGRRQWKPSPTAKVLQAAREGKGKAPWIVSGQIDVDTHDQMEGVEYLSIDLEAADSNTRWPRILKALAARGVESTMIEGGAEVIKTLLRDHRDLIDSLIVTVAPVFLSDDGVRVSSGVVGVDQLRNVQWLCLGRDAVVCGTLSRD